LAIFLDVLGETVSKEEIDEMISICDENGIIKTFRKWKSLLRVVLKINKRKFSCSYWVSIPS